ncbi:5-hydroxytryptamine receptor 4-like [Actinia tenebrosa]|uniref:5-hydroxytryptamine receptor 4-like n=1 Tax=Actinia tenebrosa TaxID=6105 RepID=A0A6P8HS35_ACTTE|nr:5-hydroxytryptamine receptor 4-like [Actinia tenebrosa]XP_031557597.1 5-hydroxytryptamine receptor 4-like [Actinia tenebrosa]XP_031557669.1 5-hydroxytryptamine receptor 4-like [Actinia tenebrosa]XP_031557746.1 5-hydroxytryptamine receptor 4-like [Actinia tenebrosa]XP_031557820.1 5-hydroxytryptamine receptor 4-like [Actinia tenebrosa]XP_031557890.1 5-hydroxytryptamine receptor 4-like [Actinia tenebrosa]XP_031557968.1 5-hydroxytryptamine receptor 4-like [Actinia tenebrosa]XP_031558039.1 5-h
MNGTEPPDVSKSRALSTSDIILVSYLCLVIVTALFGNALLGIVIIKKSLLQNVHYYFILNLVVANFLNALLKIPTSILIRVDKDWYPHYGVCYFTTPLGVLFGSASVGTLATVAINRYLVIASPFSYSDKMPPAFAKTILAGIWIGALGLAIPPTTWRSKDSICSSGGVSSEHKLSEILYFVLALWMFVIIIPSIVMFMAYFKIYLIARNHAKRMEAQQTPALTHTDQQTKKRRRDLKAAVVLAVIGGIFIICWLPFFVVQAIHKFGGHKLNPIYFNVFLCIMYTNAALDPLVLLFFNAEMRVAFVRVFCKRLIRVRPQSGGNTTCGHASAVIQT